MPTITVDNVSKYYHVKRRWGPRKKGEYEIGVENVDLTIEQGEFVYVIGSSGAGKSTLLNLISGQMKPDKGKVWLNKKPLFRGARWRRTTLPKWIGYVSQYSTLNRGITIQENLRLAARVGHRKFKSWGSTDERINKVLGLTGLTGAGPKYPGELTAGECRRVQLARALINSPPILVLDEVTANLDHDSMWDVFLLLHEINKMGTTVVMATHNIEYVNMLRRRVITLVHGRVYSDDDKGRYGEVAKKKRITTPTLS